MYLLMVWFGRVPPELRTLTAFAAMAGLAAVVTGASLLLRSI